ncbi:MAG TPA: hypothetical protein VHB02_18870 [Acidimicrobiales bacterium]|nr:hypothetical protein [Acidimicrobiales bacterium]
MPAETHQHGRLGDRDEILVLLSVLLGDGGPMPEDANLAELGIDDEPALWDLWAAVREEFGERSLGPDEGAEVLDPAMTLETAAAAMAELLDRGRVAGPGPSCWPWPG